VHTDVEERNISLAATQFAHKFGFIFYELVTKSQIPCYCRNR